LTNKIYAPRRIWLLLLMLHVTLAMGGGVSSILIGVLLFMVHVTDLVMVHVTKTVCADIIILPANSTVPGGYHIGVRRDGDGEDGDGVMMLIRRGIAIHNKQGNEYWSGNKIKRSKQCSGNGCGTTIL
jgi:hypothetical protein